MKTQHTVPTLADVAKRAGVSPKTVSRVINGEAHVKTETKMAVEKAVQELGYRPNQAARSLAASRSFFLGLITMRMDAYLFQAFHSAGVRACQERGYHLVVEELEEVSEASLRQLEQNIRNARYDGLIVSQLSDNAAVLEALDNLGIPYVRLTPHENFDHSDCVVSDEQQGFREIARHFRHLGHRRVALCALRPGRDQMIRAAMLAEGYTDTDLVFMPLNLQLSPPSNVGRDLGSAFFALPDRPSAIFAFNDEVAAGLIGYAWANGYRVPEDVSVVGFDDASLAEVVWPPLTTVRQHFDQIISAAVKLLTERQKRTEPRLIVCPVDLMVRQSTTSAH